MGSHRSMSLLFVMKVMVGHFVSNSHKVMSALTVMLTSIGCCGEKYPQLLWRFHRDFKGFVDPSA